MFRRVPTILIGFVCTATALPAFAQQRLTEAQFESIRQSKVVSAVRLTEALTVDGRLNEPVMHHPLSDIYVVYNDRRDFTGGQLLERAVIVKITNLFNF